MPTYYLPWCRSGAIVMQIKTSVEKDKYKQNVQVTCYFCALFQATNLNLLSHSFSRHIFSQLLWPVIVSPHTKKPAFIMT